MQNEATLTIRREKRERRIANARQARLDETARAVLGEALLECRKMSLHQGAHAGGPLLVCPAAAEMAWDAAYAWEAERERRLLEAK